MTAGGPMTFAYVWGLASDEEAHRATLATCYPTEAARYERERRGFARICELLTFLEANERDITQYLNAKKRKQSDEVETAADETANSRKHKTRAS